MVKVTVDLTGKRFGKWIVICRAPDKLGTEDIAMWKCICDCGTVRDVRGYTLRHGMSRSCGCVKKEGTHFTHGKSYHPLYGVWQRMKGCTESETHQDYKYYGAKGIRVYTGWLEDFENFYKWAIDNGYREGLEIDRINNDGNYEPSNCRWATRTEQMNNTSRTHRIVYDGESHTLSEWSDLVGIPHAILYSRLFYYKWSPEKTLTTPVGEG